MEKKHLISEIGEHVFEDEVLRSALPVLVSFEAPWSRPCQMVHSLLHDVASLCEGKARVFRVDVDDNPDLGLWYDIQAVPTLMCFISGQERARIVGTASAEALWKKVGPLVGINQIEEK
jgi:thioredoxin 1